MASIFTDPVQASEPFFRLLSEHTSVQIDQVTGYVMPSTVFLIVTLILNLGLKIRYIFLLSLGYPLGAIYRYGLIPSPTNCAARHIVSTSIGVIFGLLCFGWGQMAVLFTVTGVCYAMLLIVPTNMVAIYTMLFAMVSMSVAHVYRIMVDYGGWHLDFTG